MKLRTGLRHEPPDVSYLKGRLDAEEVLESMGIVVSHRKGEWIMCHCPNTENHANGDKNPSFGFNEDELVYNCFVCGGGSLLDLVKQQQALDAEDAEVWLKQHSRIETQRTSDLKSKLDKIIHKSTTPETLPELPLSTLDNFSSDYNGWIEARGISDKIAEKYGIRFDYEGHGGIIIPHFWEYKLRGYQVRHLVTEIDSQGRTHYLCGICNSPVPKYTSTKGMPKNITLYGYDMCLAEEANRVIVVESPMTVLYLASLGYHSVATFGSWGQKQMDHLSVFDRVYLWPDNDAAGAANIERVIKQLRYVTDVRIVPTVPKEKGDAADLTDEAVFEHIEAAFTPALIPIFGLIKPYEDYSPNLNIWRK